MRYSAFSLARHPLSRHRRRRCVCRDAAPKDGYEVVIVAGGGHGQATTCYLAKNRRQD